MKRLMMAGLVAATFAIGCGDDEGDTLTETEARQVFAAFADGFGDTTESIEAGSDSGSVTCPQGGGISVEGQASETSFNAVATYDNCATGNITINGSVSIAGSGNDTSFNFTISGSITVTGEVNGTCSIDVAFSSSTSGNFSVTGSICGQDVADLNMSGGG